ncbi:unnamed protein product [Adineta ricciae]|uniref:Uncharacterized protein n=1 Tax=Adineta ricciae TaxID=249248 RepID=A0A815HM34_ADIRI|nr:unnamed protein product [Adineta ricciae]
MNIVSYVPHLSFCVKAFGSGNVVSAKYQVDQHKCRFAIITHFIHNTNDGYTQYESHISHLGRYYITGVPLYIILTSFIHIIIDFACQKRLLFFRVAVIFLVLEIIIEIVTVALLFLMRTGIPAALQKTTLLVISSLTGYSFVL